MGKEKENIKGIFEGIYTGKGKFKDGTEFWFVSSKEVKSYKVNELLTNANDGNELPNMISKEYKKVFEETYHKQASEQQSKFAFDVTKLMCSDLIDNKPVLVPARAGFGKTTLIRTFLEGKILEMQVVNRPWGAIIVSDRIKDLKDLQEGIRSQYGYYNEFTYVDDSGKEQLVQDDWVYVLESWNKEICINDNIIEYDVQNCTKARCEYFDQCKMSKQLQKQTFSPILAISNVRLFNYLLNNRLGDFISWTSKFKVLEKREIMVIDEKPKLENNDDIDTRIIDEMISNVKMISGSKSMGVKSTLEKELLNAKSRLVDLEKKNIDERNTVVFNSDSQFFSNEFMECWDKHYKFIHRHKIGTIETLLTKGGLWCKTEKRNYFKLIEYIHLDWTAIKTIIFDATAETDPSYQGDFNYLNIDDYKSYNHLNINVIDENLSKGSIAEDIEKLDVICNWIKNNISELGRLYIVTYMGYSTRVYNLLKGIGNIVYDIKDGKDIIPYFNNTRGKNLWQECNYMIYMGWNRYPSDEYLASYLSVNFPFEHIRGLYFSSEDKREELGKFIPRFIGNTNGTFTDNKIEFHKLCKIMVEFEQEIFRTKVRDFGTDEQVNIYIFQPDNRLQKMIQQRFLGCNIQNVQINDLSVHKIKSRKNNESNKELALYQWLNSWDGLPKMIKELKQELGISDDYWKELKEKTLIKGVWDSKKVEQIRKGRFYYIISKA